MTDKPLELIARKVLDGEAVDWDAAKQQDHRVVANLRVVASIGETLRRQSGEADDRLLVRRLHETWSDLAPGRPASMTGGDRWGGLVIRSLLGAGASAEVYRAWDESLQREVALKLFRSDDPELQTRMLGEGRRLARVDHPGVVRVYGADRHDGRVGLWMELLDGETLATRGAREPLGEAEAAALGRELCRALSAIHAAGLVHGDIKAQNVIRRSDGRLVLTDFGSSSELTEVDATPALSGTPLYLAPEVLAGESPSARSDIYSLGVLLFHLLTGSFPVEAASLPQLREAHRDGKRRLLSDLRPALDAGLVAAIEGALATDPAQRHATAGAFAQALEAAGNPPRLVPRRRQWLVLGALASLLAAGWWLWSAPGPGYTLDSRLYRLADGASPARLESGDRVRLGDRLSLELTANQELYVWVFNEDDAGNANALFPLAALDQANPLPAGVRHVLPGGAGSLAWVIDRPARLEQIHIVSSPEPRPDLDALFGSLPPTTVDAGVFSRRGIGSVQRVDTRPTHSAAPLLQAITGTADDAPRSHGLRHQVVELRHAGE